VLNELAKEVHANSVEHGWWEDERPFGEVIALIHQELSEALEEYRQGHEYEEVYYSTGTNGKLKPEGIPIELADVVIRILDFVGWAEIDIDKAIADKVEYNKTRPYRHGGLKA
jgi:NTP pyrophosphatase (non-canonical NTP hydrolase)